MQFKARIKLMLESRTSCTTSTGIGYHNEFLRLHASRQAGKSNNQQAAASYTHTMRVYRKRHYVESRRCMPN